MMAALLEVSGKSHLVLPDSGRLDFTIQQLQELVNSPFITVIPAKRLGQDIFIVASEDGFEKDRPFHPEASRDAGRALYGNVVLAQFEELGGAKEI